MNVWKMHGCGNDFVVIDSKENMRYADLAVQLCDRHIGIGADGFIAVKRDPLEMVYYNADGTKATMCGNGIRCFAKYCWEHGYVKKNKFDVITGAGKLTIEILTEFPFTCRVNMGSPIFQNMMLHVSDNLDFFGRTIEVKDLKITVYSLFMGTVHTVIFVSDWDSEVLKYAESICKHSLFVEQTNVDFVQIIDSSTIRVKTYERGVGWTLSCGTGCCAAVVTAERLKLTDKKVKVLLELGELDIEIQKNKVFMCGSAMKVFECDYKEETEC